MDNPFASPNKRFALIFCGLGLLLFAILSYAAMHTKSATYDEATHSVGGFVHLAMGDFRINPEDPVLFGYWGALPQTEADLKIVKEAPSWNAMLDDFSTNQWIFAIDTLYQTPGNDGDGFIQRSRAMFTLVGVALGALIAWWAWKIAGPTAAIFACAFFFFDPNFAAHSSIFKNDVMLALAMASLGCALWHFGRRGTAWSLVAVVGATVLALNVKFSGILCGPIVLLALTVRALMPQAWPFLNWVLGTRRQRLAAVLAVLLLTVAACDLATWATYRFRYLPTSDPGVSLDVSKILQGARATKAWAESGGTGTVEEAAARAATRPDPAVIRGLVWAMDHRILPQPWLVGFLYTYATTQVHRSFLLGETRLIGWWYYFPCCVLFKTPTATLAAIVLVPGILFLLRRRNKTPASSATAISPTAWFVVCCAVPVTVYGGSAMLTNLNIGLRHILPLYPFLFVSLGLGMAALLKRHGRAGLILSVVIFSGLAVESLSAFPDYLSFFNFPSGGSRGGLSKLGDSNLDWGQDLKGLARWRTNHRDLPLYLAYFGTASPAFYGVDAINVPYDMGGWPMEKHPEWPEAPCYFAISATVLQGIYISDPEVTKLYANLRKSVPIDVIGGSIYLYRLPIGTQSSSSGTAP
jgi:hypothetical protein